MKQGGSLLLLIAAALLLFPFPSPAWYSKPRLDSILAELDRATNQDTRFALLKLFLEHNKCEDTIGQQRAIKQYADMARDASDELRTLEATYYHAKWCADCRQDYAVAEKEFRYCAETAKGKGFSSLELQSYHDLADMYQAQKIYAGALENYQNALNLKPDAQRLMLIWGNMGEIYNNIGNYPSALSYYEKVYTLKSAAFLGAKQPENTDSLEFMLLLVDIAQLRATLEQFDSAIANYRQVIAMNTHIGDELLNIYCYEGIGNCMIEKKMPGDARDYYEKALESSRKLNNSSEQINILNQLGNLFLGEGDLKRAAGCATQAIALDKGSMHATDAADHTYLPGIHLLLGKIYKQRGVLGNAASEIIKAIKLFHNARDAKEESDAWELLSGTYEAMGKQAAALDAFKKHVSLRDSIFSGEKTRELTRIEMTGDFERRKFADSLQQANKDAAARAALEKQKRDNKFFLAAGLLMLVIAIGAVYFLIYTRKAKRQIEMLMREMHHRVKNNLQIISTLLNLQLADMPDESARKTIEEGITRISSIALIHHHLYRIHNMASLEISSFIRELLNQVAAIYTRDDQHLTTRFHIPETVLDVDTAIPLGLALNELMTNSFKYAYLAPGECVMDIRLTRRGDLFELCYRDFGPGLPADFNIETAESLGMKIIQSLAGQLGGKFMYDRPENYFLLTFKDTSARRRTA